jgi:sialate O-acetylesterase
MIIQRDAPFPIRSRCKAKVAFLGKTYEAQPVGGKWLATIDPVSAGGPFDMDIESDKGAIRIRDIYSGDIWLAAGQSNMELPMSRVRDDYPEEWEREFPLVRQFKVPQEWDFSGPREQFSGGSWTAASRETLHEFSAAAWFFAKNLYARYKVPIGIVNAAWGGTPIESWMSRDALADFPAKITEGDKYADAAKNREIAARNEAEIQEWESRLLREDRGIDGEWRQAKADISQWESIDLPGNFSDAGLVQFCGVVWLARDFDLPQGFADSDAKIWLGTITDADTVYINGVETGNTGYRYPPRKYPVPAGLLREGKNRVVIRVTCNAGEGGVIRGKPFRIFTNNETVDLAGTWKYKAGCSALTRPKEFFFQWQPMGPYNAMIAPALKFPLKGVIWYQGESNDCSPHEYAGLFKAMITDWRKKSLNGELPFLFVQLPIFGKPSKNDESANWALIRESQSAALSLPATGMAAAIDLGEWNDLHPVNKKDIGFRLYLAAEKTLFKNDNTSPGPMLCGIQKRGRKMFLTFDNCGGGLVAKEKTYISAVSEDGLVRLPVEIEGTDEISIDLSSVRDARILLYAWANNPKDRQLYNDEGLPAVPFKISVPKN